jgi:monofunctional biosynthetic peptidoglycan transglycosylase
VLSGIPRYRIVIKHLLLAFVFFSIALVVCFRWIPPPMTAFMVETYLARFFSGKKHPAIHYRWVDYESIPPSVGLAVIAAEDQKFPYHWGFDFASISHALEERKSGGRVRGASTITQQVAKNLFLWPGRSFFRKGLEAYFTILIELIWPKRRILEVYLNIAEFGRGTFGVHSASRYLLRKSPSKLSRTDAALLAAALPNPKRFNVAGPSGYVFHRRNWILRQMSQLGGIQYLDHL